MIMHSSLIEILIHFHCRDTLFAWLISHQPAVLFSQNKSAISNQPAVLFSQNKPAPAIRHQPTEQADDLQKKMTYIGYICLICEIVYTVATFMY
jgi:hypothetical protein